MNTLKIKKMVIQGIGGITNLTLPFKDGLNLICGTNGIGKTTILECISHTFIQTSTTKLKKNVNAQKGTCTLFLVENNTEKEISYIVPVPLSRYQSLQFCNSRLASSSVTQNFDQPLLQSLCVFFIP